MDLILQESYDEEAEDDPLKRTGHIALKYKNDMIAWGGYSDEGNTCYLPSNELLIYNPTLQKWSKMMTSTDFSPPGLSGACGLVYDNYLYIFGGHCERSFMNLTVGYNNRIYQLNLCTLQWERCPVFDIRPLACDKMAGWVHGNLLYFFGGYGIRGRTGSHEMLRCHFCIDDAAMENQGWNNQLVAYDVKEKMFQWPTTSGICPNPRAAHAAAKVGSRVYLFGGRHQNVRMNDLHMLDLDTMTWSDVLETKGTIPQGRSWHSLTPISDNHIVLYGGFSQQREALNECWMLTLSSLTWCRVTLPDMRPRLWHTACMGDPGEIIIFGGCVGNILNPQVPKQAEHVIILWFSPKSLLRSCLDVVIQNSGLLRNTFPSLPGPLQKLLSMRLANPDVRRVTSFGQPVRSILREFHGFELAEDIDTDDEVD